MRSRTSISDALTHGGLAIHRWVGCRTGVGFLAQCGIIAGFSAFAVLIASAVDGSLRLQGRNVGLLQHPAIWSFIGLQVALPLAIRSSLKKLLGARGRLRNSLEIRGPFSNQVVKPLLQFLRLEDWDSRLLASVLYCAGIAAFAWNTYQNQMPGIVVRYDFWDSKTFVCGFWVTRIYKLYLFAWFLPYIALVHVAILVVTLRLIRRARIQGKLKLVPFHEDGVGGLGFLPGLITTPIIVTILIGSVSTAAAFEVHRAADVTPMIGLAIIVGGALLAYGLPILVLRADIVAVKHEMIGRIRTLQQEYYTRIIELRHLDPETLRNGKEAQDYFENICAVVRSISQYPHLKRLIGYVGLAMTPSIISFAIKVYEIAAPLSKKL